ncbi:uncharacterized protein DS421_3g75630 [Arachis hypogaea]|nr:uncharacterized protein DS421_3g75630 [Arachis hypogaea]
MTQQRSAELAVPPPPCMLHRSTITIVPPLLPTEPLPFSLLPILISLSPFLKHCNPFHWLKAEPPARATITSTICDHRVQPPPSILSFPIRSRNVKLYSWRTTSIGPELTVATNLPSSSPSSMH